MVEYEALLAETVTGWVRTTGSSTSGTFLNWSSDSSYSAREAVRYINVECYCGFAMYVRSEFDIWNPRLKNYRPNFDVNSWAVTDSWLER